MVGLNLNIPEMLPGEVDGDLSDKQKNFIISLAREVGASQFAENHEYISSLSKSQASSVLDQLLDLKKQLQGDAPIDTSKLEGLDDTPNDNDSPSSLSWIAVGAAVIVLLLILILAS